MRKCPSMTGMILWICQLSYLAHESSPFTLKRMKIYLFKFTMKVGELMHEKTILLGIQAATLMLMTLSMSMMVIKKEAQDQQGYKLQTTICWGENDICLSPTGNILLVTHIWHLQSVEYNQTEQTVEIKSHFKRMYITHSLATLVDLHWLWLWDWVYEEFVWMNCSQR